MPCWARCSRARSAAGASPRATASIGLEQEAGVRHAEHRQRVLEGDLAAAVGDELLERPQCVAEAAGGRAGDRGESLRGNLDRLRVGHPAQHRGDLLDRGPLEVEAVAAVHDRGRDLARLGRGEHEHGVRRGLLEGLQERVPGRRREHVGLVEDVDLAAPADGRVGHALAQLADVLDGVVRGGVHLEHVQRARTGDRHARLATPAGLGRGALDAVQAGGEDLRHRGLAGSAGADEQVGVVDLVPLDRVAERPGDRLLTHDLRERARPMPAIKRLSGL